MTSSISGAAAASALVERAADGSLSLRLSRCAHDGTLSFPPERFGCQRCGAHGADLAAETAPARGRVLRGVTVRRHRGPGPTPPFVVGDVTLAAGPVVRVLLERELPTGTSVAGRLERLADGDEWVVFGALGDRS